MNKNHVNIKSGICILLVLLMILSSLYTLTCFTATVYGAETEIYTDEEEEDIGEDVWRSDEDDEESEDADLLPDDEEESEESEVPEEGQVPEEDGQGELLDIMPAELLLDSVPQVIDLIMDEIKTTAPDGTPLQEPIYADENVRVTYWFHLAENAREGDMAYITLPEELRVQGEVQFELKLQDGTVALTARYDSAGHQLVLVFEIDLDADEVSGLYVYFDGDFDEDKLNNDKETTIILGTNSDGDSITVSVVPAEVTITIEKTGQFLGYLPEYNGYVVEWTLLINQEERSVSNVQMSDVLPAGLTFIDGSLTSVPADISWNVGYADSTREVSISYDGTVSQMYTVKFLSEITDFGAMPTTTVNGLTYHVAENKVTMKYDTYYGTKEDSDSSKVNTSTDLLFKSGTYNYNTKSIEWEMVINRDKMSITDAVLTDSIPAGLTLNMGSIQVYRSSGSGFESTPLSGIELDSVVSQTTTEDDGFQIQFVSPLDDCYKITYSTAVDPDFFDQNGNTTFTNKATLTGGFKGGLGGPFIIDVPVDAYSVLLSKTVGGYTQNTQIIKWNIAVNDNKISLKKSVTVIDTLDSRVTYLPDSLVVKRNGVVLTSDQYTVTEPKDSVDGLTLTVVFLDGLDGVTGNIYFETRVSDLNVLTESQVTIPNEAQLWYDGDLISKSNVYQPISTRVIQKDVADYDYRERSATWKVTVNPQLWPLSGTGNTVTDTLPGGMVLAESGIQYRIGDSGQWITMAEEASSSAETYTYTYDETEGTILFHLKDLYEKEIQLLIKTVITEDYLEEEFVTNGTKSFTNKVELFIQETGKKASDTATYNMKNTVVGKSGSYSSEDGSIQWQILVNSNALDWDMNGAAIKDVLQTGLELDTSSIALTKHGLNKDGSYTVSLETIPLTGANVQYDTSTNLFLFTFPEGLDWEYVYVLTFTTYILEDGTYKNSIDFEGHIKESDESEEMAINISGGGGGITLTERKYDLSITKVDDESGEPVAGARMAVLDQYENVFAAGVTDENGTLKLSGMLYKTKYTLAELEAPDGYVPLTQSVDFMAVKSGGVVTVTADDSDFITFNVVNHQIQVKAINRKTEIHLVKVDQETEEPLCEVTFTLEPVLEDGSEGQQEKPSGHTAVTDENGAFTFKGLWLNTTYVFREADGADGYIPFTDQIELMLVQDEKGAVALKITAPEGAEESGICSVDGDTLTITVTNTKTKVILKKTDGEDGRLLAGALFEICGEDGHEARVVITEENGEAIFEGLSYNVVYTVSELAAPAGYVTVEPFRIILLEEYPEDMDLPEDTVILVIDQDHKAVLVDVPNYQTKILIEKVRQGRPEVKLSGAVFAIYEGEALITELSATNSQGLVEVTGLEYDVVYRLKEVRAPSGYKAGSDVLFRLTPENIEPYKDENGVLVLPAMKETQECPSTITVENKRKTSGGGGGGENPGGENPGGENPGGENPGGENPGGENPGGENPGGENPGSEGPGGGIPPGGNPGGGSGGGYDPSPQTGISDEFVTLLTVLMSMAFLTILVLGRKKI